MRCCLQLTGTCTDLNLLEQIISGECKECKERTTGEIRNKIKSTFDFPPFPSRGLVCCSLIDSSSWYLTFVFGLNNNFHSTELPLLTFSIFHYNED